MQQIRNEVENWLLSQSVVSPDVVLERAASPEFGEFSINSAMRYAKKLGRNPLEFADELASFLQDKAIDGLGRVESVKPGFVNFYLSSVAKRQHVEDIIEVGSAFGSNKLHQGEKWVVEHTSPNPNKAMHIGHLRINLIGMGIVRLMKASGAEVVSDGLYNDRGISIAKVMYGYLAHSKKDSEIPTDVTYWSKHKDQWFTPAEKEMKPDHFVSECYVWGEKDFSSDHEIEKTVRKMVVDWESNHEETWQLWKLVLQYAYEGNERVLRRLGSHWDKIWYEHEHYQGGKQYVEEGLNKGVFKRLEDGAVITKLEDKYGLTDTVVLKNDGTSLYLTQDIALTDLKKKTYGADKLIWVVGPEQTLHMKQLFSVCEQLGIGKVSDFTHVSYGNVGLKSAEGRVAKMSSRDGTVILADNVIDEVKGTIINRFLKEGRGENSSSGDLAEKLALTAVKFGFLKMDKMQNIAFDVEQSVDVHGDSGLYVMYSYVRTQSILRKAGAYGAGQTAANSESGAEAQLLRSLLYYESVVVKSVEELSVHHIAQYLLELSSEFNAWYAKETILDGSEAQGFKLALVEAVGIIIQNGLNLLGIETVDEM